MTQKFQKLNIDLPRQPLSDQRVWEVAGWLLALAIVMLTVFTYIDYRKESNEFLDQSKTVYERQDLK